MNADPGITEQGNLDPHTLTMLSIQLENALASGDQAQIEAARQEIVTSRVKFQEAAKATDVLYGGLVDEYREGVSAIERERRQESLARARTGEEG